MITRKQYMANSEKLHHAYYVQIAQMSGLTAHMLPVDIAKVRTALQTDRNLNNIPLIQWDMRAHGTKQIVTRAITKCEEYPAGPNKVVWSLGDGVCILKALAKHLTSTMTIGTSYFLTKELADRYYAKQGNLSPDDVAQKIADGETNIGIPPTNDGDRIILIDDGTRFAIEVTDDTVTRYVGTYVNKDGQRTLMHASQGRFTHATEAEAQEWVDAVTKNNGPDTIKQIWGENPRFEVRPCPCYPGHFDPKNVWFD